MLINGIKIPRELETLDGHCGPLSLWLVLNSFGRHISPFEIIKESKYTKKYGTFTISLAVALKRWGFNVDFYSDLDANPKPIELKSYKEAERLGIQVHLSLSIEGLLEEIHNGKKVIVYYNTREDQGHYSPLLGKNGEYLLLPLAEAGRIRESDFIKYRQAPEIYRQSISMTA